jgi:hypothetical protein
MRKILLWAGLFPLLFMSCGLPADATDFAGEQQARIAQLVFHNECAGRLSCLTSWNQGEEFASLGLGHFIWYPAGTPEADKPFRESFPMLLAFLVRHGVVLPGWLASAKACPWPDRASFLAAQNSPRMRALRRLLQQTMPLQAAFLRHRLQQALPGILRSAPDGLRGHIGREYRRVADSPMGEYALTDYVNFKGEGVLQSERYDGQGWGLMQVLAAMHGKEPGLAAIDEFSRVADELLTRRVAHAPQARHEARWLPGWRKRLASYREEARREMLRDAQ